MILSNEDLNSIKSELALLNTLASQLVDAKNFQMLILRTISIFEGKFRVFNLLNDAQRIKLISSFKQTFQFCQLIIEQYLRIISALDDYHPCKARVAYAAMLMLKEAEVHLEQAPFMSSAKNSDLDPAHKPDSLVRRQQERRELCTLAEGLGDYAKDPCETKRQTLFNHAQEQVKKPSLIALSANFAQACVGIATISLAIMGGLLMATGIGAVLGGCLIGASVMLGMGLKIFSHISAHCESDYQHQAPPRKTILQFFSKPLLTLPNVPALEVIYQRPTLSKG